MRTTGKATDLITFSRSSGGTALRKIAYGPELVTNGTFDTDLTGWTEQSGGSVFTVSSGQLTISRSAIDPGYVYQTIDTTVGSIYSLTFDIIDDGPIDLRVGNSPAGLQITSSGIKSSAGTYTLLFVATGATAYISAVNTSYSTDATIDNISVKEVLFDQGDLTLFNHPADIPRIEYDANGNVLGLLVEESRVNLVTYSEDFTDAYWTKRKATVSSGGTAPDGSTAIKLIQDSTTDLHEFYRNLSSGSGSPVTFSIFVKAAEESGVSLRLGGANATTYVTFDLSNGSVVDTGVMDSYSIDLIGNGWYRCSVTQSGSEATGTYYAGARIARGTTVDFAGDGTSGIYIWGAQLEAGAFPTSYIPTSGSTATRAADVASIATSEFGYRDDEGTVVVEAQLQIKDVSYKGIANINTDGNNRIRIISGIYPTVIQSEIRNGGVGQFAQSENITEGAPFKAAIAYKENNTNSSVSGSAGSTDTACTIPDVVRLDIMTAMTGHIKSIKYIPRRLTNDQLVEITS